MSDLPAKRTTRSKKSRKSSKTTLAKSRWRTLSQILVSAALISILFSGLGYLGSDIWLASTQWLIVAAVLAALGIYARLESS